MSQLGEAFVPIRATLDQLDGDLDQAKGKISGALGNLQRLGKISLGALVGGLGLIAGVATTAAAGIGLLAANAEPLLGLQAGFAAVTERIGTSSEVMLAALQDASGGLITNTDLMTSFNKAAALVSDDFAATLPEAMSLVQRAAQATGQDMGFLFDSLVTGIGRVSPMILDNLGIQVSLAEVTDHAAQMFGKSAEELSKQEQQAALTEIMMRKLNETYGDIPAVDQPLARIRVAMANLRDEIGVRLLPLVQPLAASLLDLAERVIGRLLAVLEDVRIPIQFLGEALGDLFAGNAEGFFRNLTTAVFGFFEAFGASEETLNIIRELGPIFADFFDGLMSGEDIVGDFANLFWELAQVFGATEEEAAAVWHRVRDLGDTILEAKERVAAFLAPIIEAISNFVSWKDVAVGLGVAIAAVVIPAIVAIIQAIAPLILTFVAVTAAVAVLRNAWENDWGGMRTRLTEAWEGTIRPGLTQLWEWLQVKVPAAIETLKRFWEGTLFPALQTVWAWMTGTLFPALQAFFKWLHDDLVIAIQRMTNFWNTVLYPALQTVWAWMTGTLFPTLSEWWEWMSTKLTAAMQTLTNIWNNVLKPALEALWSFVQDNVIPILSALREMVEVLLVAAFTALQVVWVNVLKPALEALWAFVQDDVIPILETFWDWLENKLTSAFGTLSDFWYDTLKPALESLANFVGGTVIAGALNAFQGFINGAKGALEGFKGLIDGVIGAIQSLIGWLQSLGDAQDNYEEPDLEGGDGDGGGGGGGDDALANFFGFGAGGGAAGGGAATVNNYYLNVTSEQASEDIVTDFWLMAAAT